MLCLSNSYNNELNSCLILGVKEYYPLDDMMYSKIFSTNDFWSTTCLAMLIMFKSDLVSMAISLLRISSWISDFEHSKIGRMFQMLDGFMMI